MTTVLLPAPRRRPGALMAPTLDQRPCVTHPPQWWDLGHDNNDLALRGCTDCRLPDRCMPTGEPPRGVIRAGNAYDDQGNRLAICTTCGHPRIRRSFGGPVTCRCPKKPTRRPA